YWNAGRDKDAIEIIEMTLDRFPKSPMPGTVSMCIALVRHGQAEPPVGELSPWTRLGLSGFLRTGAIETASAAIAKFNLDLDNAEDFQLLRLFGKQVLIEADKTKDADKYRLVKTVLEKALAKPEATSDVDAVADIRFTLGLAYLRLNDLAT